MLLELKALREGCWKLSEFTAYSGRLVLRVSAALKALLAVSNKAHPELQAMLIDLMLYRPKFLVAEERVAPASLGMEEVAHET